MLFFFFFGEMAVEQTKPENPATMSNETEQNKSFIKALQELKNLRPQLYSAAEYCEKSYQCCKQQQMVIDNLKDYAVRALVNAVDHLGTVAYKLTDILEQQSLDVSMMELKVSCLDQRLLTCQTYTDHEGLRQQQLLPTIPRLHKHYTLPAPGICPVNKNVQTSSLIHRSLRAHIQTRQHLFLSGVPAAKTLSWHLASGAKSKVKKGSVSDETGKSSGRTLSDADKIIKAKSPARPLALRAGPASSVAMRTLGITRRDALGGYNPMTPCRKTTRAPIRSKSAISAFFVKQKTRKLKTRVKEDNPRNPRMHQEK
ncbi:PREDICTED: protein ABIL1-like isoform X2 [Ipomoea nil]|uniref:protein ABIL1-like isoform X2 n=1 Tax=Ipomoea nil TaxID=35883 RepID=UPI000900D367|nr:PREDICTED: protein ABIL1-like isoform X2 [Ipomoea nil]